MNVTKAKTAYLSHDYSLFYTNPQLITKKPKQTPIQSLQLTI